MASAPPNTIASYPAAAAPLDGSEDLAAWQNGQQVKITTTEIASFQKDESVSAAIEAVQPLVDDATAARNDAQASAGEAQESAAEVAGVIGIVSPPSPPSRFPLVSIAGKIPLWMINGLLGGKGVTPDLAKSIVSIVAGLFDTTVATTRNAKRVPLLMSGTKIPLWMDDGAIGFSKLDQGTLDYLANVLGGATSSKRWKGKNWVGAGDSITATLHSGPFWMPQTAAYLGATLTNVAVSGHRMIDVLTDPQFTQANIQANDLATVAHGTNDWSTNVPLGTAADAKTDATFAGNIKNIIETVIGWNPGITLAFRTPLQRNYQQTESLTNLNGATLLQFVDMIIEIASEQYGLPVYDAYRNSGFNQPHLLLTDQSVAWTQDGLHPNAIGGDHLWQPWGHWLETL